jgi:hypothetical protein
MEDFFISYHEADRSWAEWTAWQLESAGTPSPRADPRHGVQAVLAPYHARHGRRHHRSCVDHY